MDKIKRIIKLFVEILALCLTIIVIWCIVFPEKKLGKGYFYDNDDDRIFGPVIDIPREVLQYDYNRRYIVVKQRPEKWPDDPLYERTYSYPWGRDTIYYWIIDKQENSYYGPMLYDEFDSIFNTLEGKKKLSIDKP